VKNVHKSLYLNHSVLESLFFCQVQEEVMMGRGQERDIFVDRLIHASVTNHYDSDGSSSLCATAKDRNGYLKIF
jgi:hypothetical protein